MNRELRRQALSDSVARNLFGAAALCTADSSLKATLLATTNRD